MAGNTCAAGGIGAAEELASTPRHPLRRSAPETTLSAEPIVRLLLFMGTSMLTGPGAGCMPAPSEFHKDARGQHELAPPQVRVPYAARAGTGRRCPDGVACSCRRAALAGEVLRVSVIAARRRHAAATGKVRDVRVAITG